MIPLITADYTVLRQAFPRQFATIVFGLSFNRPFVLVANHRVFVVSSTQHRMQMLTFVPIPTIHTIYLQYVSSPSFVGTITSLVRHYDIIAARKREFKWCDTLFVYDNYKIRKD